MQWKNIKFKNYDLYTLVTPNVMFLLFFLVWATQPNGAILLTQLAVIGAIKVYKS